MDFEILTIEKIQGAFERALELSSDRDLAMRAAAQSLNIPVESVRDALAISEGTPA